MIISPLSEVTCLSPHDRGPRPQAIDRITIHCVVGQCTAEALGWWFQQATPVHSCNYGVDRSGRIVTIVPEDRVSICSSSYANDARSVTIETASDTTAPYTVTDAALGSLIRLCVDICRRNGKTECIWEPDKNKALTMQLLPRQLLLTVHRWFAPRSCPGDYLYSLHSEIAAEVTRLLTIKEEVFPMYQTIDDIPLWAFETIHKLIRLNLLQGTNDGKLNLSYDLCRTLVILDRAGVFPNDD